MRGVNVAIGRFTGRGGSCFAGGSLLTSRSMKFTIPFLLLGIVNCANTSSQKEPPVAPPPAASPADEKISLSKDTPVIHNDDVVVKRIGELCPFTLIEMAHEKIVRVDCDGTFAERRQSDVIKMKKKVQFPARGTWSVKDNEFVFSWEGEPARGYTIDVMKGILFIDGVDIKKKNATYKIDALE